MRTDSLYLEQFYKPELAELVHEYFEAFTAKDLDKLEEMYDDDILLADWEGMHEGKKAVLKANKECFDNNETHEILVNKIYEKKDNSVACEINIKFKDFELSVADIVEFTSENKILRIRAYKLFLRSDITPPNKVVNRMMKLLILDIDGVMTDGTKTYDLDGMPISKRYCDKDFTAIKRFKAGGTKVCFLSGCNKVNEAMAKNRNIDFHYARGKDKADFVPGFVKQYGVEPKDMAYIGDDLFDLSIMKLVGYAFCTKDSPKDILDFVSAKIDWKEFQPISHIVNRNGGENVIAALYDHCIEKTLVNPSTMKEVEELDKKESF
jgi:3-deoxy-D-manno-octulosonate 8-phosphate phosphatase (KDO 8-P phosphatase)